MKSKILAISSPGGHFIQLLQILPAVEGHQVVIACSHPDYGARVPGARFRRIPDASMDAKLRLLGQAIAVLWCLILERPDVVISTGASSGYLALRMGKWLGARTIWIDSLANVEKLSLSGSKVKPYADLWLTQWEHLASPSGPRYMGAVL